MLAGQAAGTAGRLVPKWYGVFGTLGGAPEFDPLSGTRLAAGCTGGKPAGTVAGKGTVLALGARFPASVGVSEGCKDIGSHVEIGTTRHRERPSLPGLSAASADAILPSQECGTADVVENGCNQWRSRQGY